MRLVAQYQTSAFEDQEHRLGQFKTVSRYIFAAGMVAVVVLSLLPGKDMPSVGVSDKIEHVVAYALLGLAGGLAFPTRRAMLLLLVLLPILGIALEVAQLFVPERSAEVADALAGWIGTSLTLLPLLLLRLSSAKRQ
jgi:VanZ family protein